MMIIWLAKAYLEMYKLSDVKDYHEVDYLRFSCIFKSNLLDALIRPYSKCCHAIWRHRHAVVTTGL